MPVEFCALVGGFVQSTKTRCPRLLFRGRHAGASFAVSPAARASIGFLCLTMMVCRINVQCRFAKQAFFAADSG